MATLVPNVYGITMSSQDLNQVSLEVLDTQLLYMDDTPGYYYDNADLIKVTVRVTSNGGEDFIVKDRMFRIWVMEPNPLLSTPENEVLEQVDNYYNIYDDQLEVNYDNIHSRELYEECDIISKFVRPDLPQIFTICYEVKRSWTGDPVSMDGSKKYFLVMSDATQGTSCHRTCYQVPLFDNLNYDKEKMPQWIQNLFDWHKQGLVSNSQFQTTINYLKERGIITQSTKETKVTPSTSLEEKNQLLKDYQSKISAAQASNLYVSGMSSYEAKYFEDFAGVLCRQQNNIVTFSGDYTNDDAFYDAVFFKLLLFDEKSNVVETGLSKIVDVVPGEYRHFEVSAPYKEKFHHCLGIIEAKFPKE